MRTRVKRTEGSVQRVGARAAAALCVLYCALALAGCNGDFDQRQEVAKTQGFGASSVGTVVNPDYSIFIRGTVSSGGAVKGAFVTLRPVLADGSVDWADANALGTGITFDNGIYQVYLNNHSYRGPILVEIKGGAGVKGANPATALTSKFHDMRSDHVFHTVVPFYDGYSVSLVDASPLTTAAVARCLAFDGSIAGVQGGISTGLFGLVCQQVAEFFGLDRIRGAVPADYAASGLFGSADYYGRVLAALSQVAFNLGVANTFDFWAGMRLDALDDGELNGSIGLVPNTPVAMPDLGGANLIGTALRDDFMDPLNLERLAGGDNTQIVAGSTLDDLINLLDTVRDVDTAVRTYDLTVRVPGTLALPRGSVHQTRVAALDQIGTSINFHPYGDSAGPSFVEFAWVSSSPANVSVQQYGRISVDAAAPPGRYTLTLTIQPAAGQTYVTGPTQVHTVFVDVP